MSMARRVAWLLVAVVLLGLGSSLVIHTLASRQALQSELSLRNQEAAEALALALGLQRGDMAAIRELATARSQQGSYRRIVLHLPDGSAALDVFKPSPPRRAPAWFVDALPLAPRAGQSKVYHGETVLATLGVESRLAWAYDAMWDAGTVMAILLAALAGVAAVLGAWLLHAWLRPLQATVAQARALEQGQFVEAPEPSLPELRALTRSMNAMVRRLREVFTAQADQVEVLQRQAQLDAVTGLPLRRHFLGRLQAQLMEPGGPGAALILVRVLQLEYLNERLGHEATDRLLSATAGLLQAYVERVPGTFAGRLNGSDLALCLPVTGVAAETAQSLHSTLLAAPSLHAGGAHIVVGGVDDLSGMVAGAALAAADAALAQAEGDGGLAVHASQNSVADPAGARAWREQIASALAEGRTALAEVPVCDRNGQRIHWLCPLRVQLTPGGEYHPAGRWLALARRSRLLPEVDLAGIDLALAAIARDGQPRAVQVALLSLAAPGFVLDVASHLKAAPEAARGLCLEWGGDAGTTADVQGLAEVAALWRPLGVQVGLEHAGALAQQLARLGNLGLQYVRFDPRHLRGAARDDAVRAYAQSLVSLVHGLGMRALAADADDAEDLRALWDLGFDGASGSAVTQAAPA